MKLPDWFWNALGAVVMFPIFCYEWDNGDNHL
jgi:hypothetical protein